MADDPTPENGNKPEPENPENQPEDVSGLKKALETERAQRREAEKRAKQFERDHNSLKERLDNLEAQSQTEAEKALNKAREEAAAEARREERQKAHEVLRKAEVRVAAAKKLADAEDAVRLLDLDSFEVGEDGTVDRKAIDKAIDDLIESKPYLKAGDPKPSVRPDVGGGARGGDPDKRIDVDKVKEGVAARTGIR